jgi:uncharacterized membrane protein
MIMPPKKVSRKGSTDSTRRIVGWLLTLGGVLGALFAFGARTIVVICLALLTTGILKVVTGSALDRVKR